MLQNLEVLLAVIVFILIAVSSVWVLRTRQLRELQRRGLLIFGILTVVPILALVFLSSWMSANMVEARRLDHLRLAADIKQQQFALWFDELERTILSELGQAQTTRTMLLTSALDSPEFSSASEVQLVRLNNMLITFSEFESLSLLNLQGEVVLSTDVSEVGKRYPEEIYFRSALRDSYIRVPQYSLTTSEMAGIVAYPVSDEGGTSVGVFVAQVRGNTWYKIVEDVIGLGQTEEIYLVDAHYNLLTPLPLGGGATYLPSAAIRTAIDRQGEVLGRLRNHRDRDVLAIYRWLPELNAALAIELDRYEALNIIWLIGILNLTAATVLLGIAGVLAFLTLRGIATPVAELADVASGIVRGEWGKVHELRGNDDLARLTHKFNHMVGYFRQRIEDLEKQVTKQVGVLEGRSAQLEATMQILRQVVLLRDVDELLSLTVTQLSKQFGFHHVAVFLLDDSHHQALLRAASSGIGRQMLVEKYCVPVGMDNLVGSVALQKKLRIVFDVGTDILDSESGLLPQTHSRALIPLSVRDKVIGVLDVQSNEAAMFTVGGTAYLQTVADQVALALDNARLLTATEERLGEIRQLLRGQSAEDWQRFVQERPHWGYTYDGVEVKSKPTATFAKRSPQLVLPVQEGQQLIGSFKAFWDRSEPNSYDVELAQEVMDQASQALESARLFTRMQGALEEVGVLYRSSQALVAARTSEQILRAFVDYLVASGIDRCILALLEPYTSEDDMILRVEAVWESGKAKSSLLGDRWALSRIPALVAVVRGDSPTQPWVIADTSNSSDYLDDISREVFMGIFRVRAMLLVPLVAAGKVLGWLLVESLHAPYAFTEREVRMYRSLADQAAIVLQSLHLLDEVSLRADHERRITTIAAEIRRHTDTEAILQTSILELSRALQAAEGFIQIGFDAEAVVKTGDIESEDKR
ncbi:MAG: GAF domain-containing protein [Anaerolineae bacterium]|nr:GAF domain-containing protein [Anaerolineae bacterium]